jgi:hypothetical protein
MSGGTLGRKPPPGQTEKTTADNRLGVWLSQRTLGVIGPTGFRPGTFGMNVTNSV